MTFFYIKPPKNGKNIILNYKPFQKLVEEYYQWKILNYSEMMNLN